MAVGWHPFDAWNAIAGKFVGDVVGAQLGRCELRNPYRSGGAWTGRREKRTAGRKQSMDLDWNIERQHSDGHWVPALSKILGDRLFDVDPDFASTRDPQPLVAFSLRDPGTRICAGNASRADRVSQSFGSADHRRKRAPMIRRQKSA